MNRFTQASDRPAATQLLERPHGYRPEKMQRLLARAEKKSGRQRGCPHPGAPGPPSGVNTATTLVEHKKAPLVVTAHDVDPREPVVFLPALCRKVGVPYCIIKGEARVGRLAHRKPCTTVTCTQVDSEEKGALAELVGAPGPTTMTYNDTHHHWAVSMPGPMSAARIAQLDKATAKELATKLG
ncbi:60S ribosomal protein L7a-like [Phyllostomus discolor]|uniref:60S ribosomal protein L7a n=1 Tax=Phyllostomus discolor TaxID=89673 RepID=A0A7E6CRE7_9CHIR|nr:60S ribosomal protein L7a-like [Phyllostomus discolor]